MIEPIEGKGVHRANAICDDCGRSEAVACDYIRAAGNKWSPNEGQAKKKITAQGWSDVKGKLRCPSCEAKRKVVPMKAKEEPKANAPEEPSKAKKREIIATLEEFYDEAAGRYKAGETDETIAELCGVMPGWVAKWREELFGPDGGNEDIEDLIARLDASEKSVQAILDSASQQHEAASKKLAEVSAMRADLDRIKKAVGPRVMAKARA